MLHWQRPCKLLYLVQNVDVNIDQSDWEGVPYTMNRLDKSVELSIANLLPERCYTGM